jgi:hypothetical protein
MEFLEMDGKPSPQALTVCGIYKMLETRVVKEQSGKS